MKIKLLVIGCICLAAWIFMLINGGQKISENPLLSGCHNPSFDPIQINQNGSVKPAKIVRKYMAQVCCLSKASVPYYVFEVPENTLVVASHNYHKSTSKHNNKHGIIRNFEIIFDSGKISSLMLKEAQKIYEKEKEKYTIHYVDLYSRSSYKRRSSYEYGDKYYADPIASVPDFESLVKTFLKSDISDTFEIPGVD